MFWGHAGVGCNGREVRDNVRVFVVKQGRVVNS